MKTITKVFANIMLTHAIDEKKKKNRNFMQLFFFSFSLKNIVI